MPKLSSPSSQVCLEDGQCTAGYTGVLCENCDQAGGFYKSSAYSCSKCGEDWQTWALFILSFLFQLWIMLYQCYAHFEQQQRQKVVRCLKLGWGYYLLGEGSITQILKQLIFHFQIMGLIATFQPLPISLQDVIGALFSSHLIVSRSVLCIIDPADIGLGSLPSSLVIEIINTAVILTQYLLLSLTVQFLMLRGKTGYSFSSKFTVCTLILASFTYSSSLSTAVQYISTRTVLGERYSALDLSISKDSQLYRGFLYLYSLPSALLWGVLFPAAVAYILFKSRKSLTVTQFQEKYLYLVREYTESGYFWELCKIVYICVLIVLIQLLNGEFYFQSSIICVMVILFNVLQRQVKPFKSLVTQRIFNLCSNIQLVTLLYGIAAKPVFGGLSSEGAGSSGGSLVQVALYVYFGVLIAI